MKLFIDSANIDEITEISKLGIICGVTTNPSLISKEGRNLHEVIKEICSLVDGPISGEVMSEESEGMVSEAIDISKFHPNMVIKIPMSSEGLKAVHQLSGKGIKTNVTLVFTASQALLAARAGATYVSPFVGRLDDISQKGMELIENISTIFAIHDIETQIITASIRNPLHLVEAAMAGSDIATVPYKILKQCIDHPLTTIGIERFKADYEKSKR